MVLPSRRGALRYGFEHGVWAAVAWLFVTIRGEPAIAREDRAATLYSVGPTREPDHEAVIRFGGEAPRRRAHSNERFNDHVQARVTTTSDRDRPAGRTDLAGRPKPYACAP